MLFSRTEISIELQAFSQVTNIILLFGDYSTILPILLYMLMLVADFLGEFQLFFQTSPNYYCH